MKVIEIKEDFAIQFDSNQVRINDNPVTQRTKVFLIIFFNLIFTLPEKGVK